MKYFNKDDNYIIAECECGKVLKIPRERVKISKCGYNVIPPIKCPCGKIDDRIEGFEQQSSIINNTNLTEQPKRNLLSIIILIILLLPFLYMIHGCIGIISDSSDSPTKYEDRTNKQDQQFKKWDAEQQQKKWENEKVNK